MLNFSTVLTLVLCFVCCRCSRVWIHKNGYRNVLVALPSDVRAEERVRLIKNVEDIFQESSRILQSSTKGRAYFSEVTVLLPGDWVLSPDNPILRTTSYNASRVVEAQATESASNADVVVTKEGQHSFVLHHQGCGKQALRIQMPKDYILRKDLREQGVEFTRLWSEYRYGVFPEGGFQNDGRFPIKYSIAGKTEEWKTGCRDNKYWIPGTCPNNERCEISSIMDQHSPITATRFCEGEMSLGPRHDSESPSKHNLLCKEEGTWPTVMRSADFVRGKNAAPRNNTDTLVSFKYVWESNAPNFVVAIEASSRMKPESRYKAAKTAFSRFVHSVLPDRSQLTLFSFGGHRGTFLVKPATIISDEESRTSYLESVPLPEEPEDSNHVCLDCLIEAVMENMVDAENNTLSYTLVLVTTVTNFTRYDYYRAQIIKSGIKLNVLLSGSTDVNQVELSKMSGLISESGGELVYVGVDSLGDLNKGMSKVARSEKSEVLVFQDYLLEDDDVDLEIPFTVDSSLTKSIKVSLTGTCFCTPPLRFDRTTLRTPNGLILTFKRKELLPAWIVDIPNAEVGEYVLTTRRKEDSLSPVLLYVTGTPSPETDSITVDVWTETLSGTEVSPPPIQIFAEVKAGRDPLKGAKVIAYVRHPDKAETELSLIDDGLGGVDITAGDGIYSRYFTNFTKAGFYNVYVKVYSDQLDTSILKGPTTFCCGSSFSFSESRNTGQFSREAGPSSFYISQISDGSDHYPPSRITDLKLEILYDHIHVLQWTAVGGDFDSGFAEHYELKMFQDRSIARNRFSDSGLEIYSEVFENTQKVEYGAKLNHALKIPKKAKEGKYYFVVRAVDGAGNAGEPSNVIPVMITQNSSYPTCQESQPMAERLVYDNNSASTISLINSLIFMIFCLFYNLCVISHLIS